MITNIQNSFVMNINMKHETTVLLLNKNIMFSYRTEQNRCSQVTLPFIIIIIIIIIIIMNSSTLDTFNNELM